MVIKFKALYPEAEQAYLDTTELPEDAGMYILKYSDDGIYLYQNFMNPTIEQNQEFIQNIVDLGFAVVGEV